MEKFRRTKYEIEQENWLFCFLIGFFGGIFLCLLEKQLNGVGSTNALEVLLWQMENYEFQFKEYFVHLLQKRMFLWIGLTVIATTYWGMWALKAFMVWCGAALGSLLSIYFVRFGAKGVGYVFCLMFPQMICYVPSYLLLCFILADLYCRLYQTRQWEGYVARENKYKKAKKIGCYLMVLLVAIIGVGLECYVNPMIVKRLKNFF